MKLTGLLVVLALLCSTCTVDSGRILGIFHYPSRSHHILGSALLKALAKRGHQVTMISPFSSREPLGNYTELQIMSDIFYKDTKQKDEVLDDIKTTYGKLMRTLKIFSMKLEYANILKDETFHKLMTSNATFDLIIQFWSMSEAFVGLSQQFQAPMIGFSAIGGNFHVNYALNSPSPYSYIPNHLLPFSDDMNLLQKSINTLVSLSVDIYLKIYVVPFQKRLYSEVFPNATPFEQALEAVDLYLINSHICTESPRSYLPNMVQIGGFHIEEKKSLPPDLQEYLDSATEGVVYFSMGTNIKSLALTESFKRAFLDAFAKLKMKVLWKFEIDLLEKSSNVRIGKWLPQNDVLSHPNVKVFITHGGMGSVTEAIYHGVPFIGIPFFLDQANNIAVSVAKGIAVEIKHTDICEFGVLEAIGKILNHSSYRQNIQILSSIYREQPIKPIDKAIYWVEHVMEHRGAKHLKAAGSKLSFYQYYLLDVIGSLVVVLFGCAFLIYYGFKLVFKIIYAVLVLVKIEKLKQE